jgi:hypothetical protein
MGRFVDTLQTAMARRAEEMMKKIRKVFLDQLEYTSSMPILNPASEYPNPPRRDTPGPWVTFP